MKREPDQVDEVLSRVTEIAAGGDLVRALELVEPLQEKMPEDRRVLGVLGGVLWRQGKLREASSCFRKVTVMSPRSELASVGLFHCLWQLGNVEEAKAEAVRLLSLRESAEYESLLEELGWEFRDGEVLARSSPHD